MKKFIFILLAILLNFTGCENEEQNNLAPNIVGTWTGNHPFGCITHFFTLNITDQDEGILSGYFVYSDGSGYAIFDPVSNIHGNEIYIDCTSYIEGDTIPMLHSIFSGTVDSKRNCMYGIVIFNDVLDFYWSAVKDSVYSK